jgi:TolB-like protein/Flp pilus assembly protein TadD
MSEQAPRRRLAAILAADVVGYSRMMQADEAGTLAALKDVRKNVIEPLIQKHDGRLVKEMGDGLLVEFASAVSAVTCAVELQGELAATSTDIRDDRRLVIRIGINVGDVIVEGADLFGDGVNVAARLEGVARPGTVCVSQTVYDQVKGKVPFQFKDLGEQHLKNIVGPIRAYLARSKEQASVPQPSLVMSNRPSIAVLPFTNMSGDPEQEYFSDGTTEDIVTELSRFRSLFVIAHNSSLAYKGRALDLREIGRNLGVRYIVEGSIRRAGNHVRVTAQLIDAGTGNHLWAERYDRDLEDIFSVQVDIARRIVTSLGARIEAEDLDLAKRKPPEDMRAYDYYLRAKPLVETPHDAADLNQARDYCDRAIEIDPSYARAHAAKAFSYIVGILLMEAENVEEWRRRALHCAETAVSLDPMDEFCHWSLGEAAVQAKQYQRALDHMARALTINPNDANVLAASGYVHALTGDPEAGLRQMGTALERNPSSPSWYHWLRGTILYILGRFDEALRAFNLHGMSNPSILRWRAVTLVELGRIDEARADIQSLLAIRPGVTVSEARRFLDYTPNPDHYLDSLRKAGLPE